MVSCKINEFSADRTFIAFFLKIDRSLLIVLAICEIKFPTFDLPLTTQKRRHTLIIYSIETRLEDNNID